MWLLITPISPIAIGTSTAALALATRPSQNLALRGALPENRLSKIATPRTNRDQQMTNKIDSDSTLLCGHFFR